MAPPGVSAEAASVAADDNDQKSEQHSRFEQNYN
jgi:hypothetical protein